MKHLINLVWVMLFSFACVLFGQTSEKRFIQPDGQGRFVQISSEAPCIPPDFMEEFARRIGDVSRKSSRFPLFIWPVENAIHDDLILVNYVDNNNSSAIVDYMGNPHSYNGHAGTDITLYSFRSMDRGIRNLAAAAGTVTEAVFSNGDRNFQPPFPDNGNYVIIQHSDGSFAAYWHFRKNSVTVTPGERVQAGQVLGFAGSSGSSTDAHLHFEVGEIVAGNWRKRDPWHGTVNTLPGLWEHQEPYVGTLPLRIYDIGITTNAASGGNPNNIPTGFFKEGFIQPLLQGANEPYLIVWMLMQGQQGDPLSVTLRRPGGAVFRRVNYTLPVRWRYGWGYWYWDFAGNVALSDYGAWTVEAASNGSILKTFEFEVGENTVYKPRFWPISGRSIRINGTEQFDVLRMSPLNSEVAITLQNAPDFASMINDSTVRIDAVSSQPYRSHYFEAIAEDAAGHADTFYYHIVDPSKPHLPLTGIADAAPEQLPAGIRLYQNYPNPFNPGTTIPFSIPASGEATLTIYDLLGKEVSSITQFLSAGAHQYEWQAGGFASGIYLYQLTVSAGNAPVQQSEVRKLLLIR